LEAGRDEIRVEGLGTGRMRLRVTVRMRAWARAGCGPAEGSGGRGCRRMDDARMRRQVRAYVPAFSPSARHTPLSGRGARPASGRGRAHPEAVPSPGGGRIRRAGRTGGRGRRTRIRGVAYALAGEGARRKAHHPAARGPEARRAGPGREGGRAGAGPRQGARDPGGAASSGNVGGSFEQGIIYA
jgi:hypothetical protein